MKKIIASLLSILALFIVFTFSATASDNISVYLNGKKLEFDIEPQITNDRTMVPMRKIFESIGAIVEWDASSKTITALKNSDKIIIQVDNNTMIKNNQSIELDVSPVVIGGRTLVPVRAVAEAFNADVQWSSRNTAVVIGTDGIYAYADYPQIPDFGRYYSYKKTKEEYLENKKKLITYEHDYADKTENDAAFNRAISVLANYKVDYGKEGSKTYIIDKDIKFHIEFDYGFWKVTINDLNIPDKDLKFEDDYDLWNYLRVKFGDLVIDGYTYDMSIYIDKNTSSSKAYDYHLTSGCSDEKDTERLLRYEKHRTLLMAWQEKIARKMMSLFPGKKISGNIEYVYYDYPTLYIDRHSGTALRWANYDLSVRSEDAYNLTQAGELRWFED